MADQNTNLNIVVSAKDEASATLKKVGDSTGSLRSAVFEATAAWDLLKSGVQKAAQFIEGSVSAYLDAQKTIDLTRATVESMGKSFDAVGPQLQAFGDKMVTMGVDGEDAALSAAKLAKAAGNDVPKGMQLAKLAADLASSGYGDLQSNTDTLTSVLAGRGTMALKEYRLNLSDTASTGEILNAIQGKVTQTTEEYADTIPGKIQTVKQGFQELEQEVGKALVASLQAAFSGTGDLTDGMDIMKEVGHGLSIGMFELVNFFVAIYKSAVVLGKGLNVVVTGFIAIKDLLKGDVDGAMAEAKSSVDEYTKSADSMNQTISDMFNPTQALTAAEKSLDEQHKTTAVSAVKVGTGIANANKTATDSYKQHLQAVTDMKQSYTDLKNKAAVDLADLAGTFQSDMADINKSIAATQQQISDLGSSFSRDQANDTASVADKIVASEQKIKDLKSQLAKETDESRAADLRSQLADEQKNYDSSLDFRTQNAQAIAEAERRAGETELQREVEDYNTRRSLAQQEYNEKLAQLQQELSDLQNKKDAEIALYNQRTTEINKILDDANKYYVQLSNDRLKQTTDEVNAEKKLFNDLASTISQVKSAASSSISSISVPSIGKRASGGPVEAGMPYIVGEEGEELFVPTQSGIIVPNGAISSGGGASAPAGRIGVSSGGGDTIINLSGTFYTDDQTAKKFADLIAKNLIQQRKLKSY